MADFSTIKAQIDSNVTTNGVGAITGAKLNDTLNGMVDAVNAAKQDTLEFDTTPTEDSTKPVTSGGVHDALEAAAQDVATTLGDYYKKTEANTLLSAKADDNAVVHNTGDENIYGVKSFQSNAMMYGSGNYVNKVLVTKLTMASNGGGIDANGKPVTDLPTPSADTDAATKKYVDDGLATKQDTLTIDAVPTDGSDNPVASNGVYDALATKQDTLTFDAEPTAGSTKPVTSSGVNDAIIRKNCEFKQDGVSVNTVIPALANLPTGSTIFVYPDSVPIRVTYTNSTTHQIAIDETYTTTGALTRVQARAAGNVHILINRNDYAFADDRATYGKISLVNLIDENVVVNLEDVSLIPTGSTIKLFPERMIGRIPKGAKVHIETSDFSSFLSQVRYYINGASSAQSITQTETILTFNVDIDQFRLAVANADFINQNGGTLDIKVWWEDVATMLQDATDNIANLQRNVVDIDADAIKAAAGNLYDSVNDKITEGEFYITIDSPKNATNDLLCRYVAKYTSSGSDYPWIRVYYNATPLNSAQNRFRYQLGGEDCYRYGECKCIAPGILEWSNQAYSSNYIVYICVPAGCELYLNQFEAKYTNAINKDAYPIFNHGQAFGSGFNAENNWRGWSHIGNYGAVVVPKATADGRFVCYHDDGKLADNGDVETIDGSTLPDKTMSQCTFAETQNLQYITTNYFGDHDKIPSLDLFFQYCASMGVHPMLSVHPSLDATQWQAVKDLAEKYKVLDKLVIKGNYSASIAATIFGVFGDSIEAYIPDKSDATITDVQDLAAVGWDTEKVKVGFEVMASEGQPIFSDTIISALNSNGMVWGLYMTTSVNFLPDAKFIADCIAKGCWEFTSDLFFSNGLIWY